MNQLCVHFTQAGFGDGLLNFLCAHFQLLCGKQRDPLSISGHYPGMLVLYLLPLKNRLFLLCCGPTDPQTSDSLKQVTEVVLAVVVPGAGFRGAAVGVLAVCVQQGSCRVSLCT